MSLDRNKPRLFNSILLRIATRTVKMDDDDRDYRYNCYMNEDIEGFPPPPQSPKPVKSGAFSYDNKNGLRVRDISRAPLGDLTLLFRKNAPSWRRAIATKPWLTAQLRLYDIAFDKSAKVGELRATLEAAVKGRKVSECATCAQVEVKTCRCSLLF